MNRRLAFPLVLLWLFVVLAGSLLPGFKVRVAITGAPHYLLHLVGFAFPSFVLSSLRPRRGWRAGLLLAAMGVFIELLQWRFYNRLYAVEWRDIVADLAGVAAGMLAAGILPVAAPPNRPSPIRAHWVHHSPSPYQADLYRSLHQLAGVELHVHHVLPRVEDRPWLTSFTSGYRERAFRLVLGLDWTLLRLVFLEEDSFFILACWGDPTNQLAMLLARLLGRRYAMWNDTPDFTRKRGRVKAAVRRIFLRLAFHGAHAVMGTGRPALQVMEDMGCPVAKLINFPCFVDVSSFPERTNWYPGARPLVFVSSGRLVEDKGYSLSLEALARVFRGNPGGFRYRILGTGPYLVSLKRQASQLGISESVEFLGWVEPAVSREVLESADVFLHPSHFEPFGVVILEAMASGLVVIASSDTAAAVDRIEPGVNGFLHETGMAGQVCDAMRALLDCPALVRRLGTAARHTAAEWPLERAQRLFLGMIES